MSGEGQQELDNLTKAGFSGDDLSNWQAQKTSELTAAGFSQQEVGDYFGNPGPSDKTDAAIKQHFDAAIGDAATIAKGDGVAPAKPFTFEDALSAGWQGSVTGLMKRGKVPDMTVPENANWYQRLAANSASMAGDIPAMVGGALVGGAGGAETGPGAVLTAAGGAFAMPALLRSTMMDAYSKGEFHSPSDFIKRAGGIFIDTAKGYVTGAATGGAGLAAKPLLGALGAGALTTTLGTSSAEVGAMVTTSKALDGQLPHPQDFLDGALTIGAFHTVPFLAGKVQDSAEAVKAAVQDHVPGLADALRNVYAKTGVKPEDVTHAATQDPTIAQDLFTKPKGEVPDAYMDQVDPYFAPKEEAKPVEPETSSAPEPGSLEEAQKNILDKIQTGGETPKAGLSFDNFYTKMIDGMNPLKLAVDKMTGGEDLPIAQDPYKLARLTRGSFGKADQFLTESPYKFDSYENVGKSLKAIVEPFKNDLDGLRSFIVAKRAQELEARGIKSGFNIDDANKVVAEAGDKYGTAAQDLTDFQNHVTNYLRDSGVLSKDAADAMNEANKNYVPFYRVFDNEGLTSGGAGKGLGTKNPLKAIKGSDRAIIDPIESIIKNTYTYLALADRNAVGQKFIELAEKSGKLAGVGDNGGPPIEDMIAEKQPAPVAGTTISDPEMTKFLQSQGIDHVPDDLLTVFRAARQPLGPDEISVFNDGKRSVYKLNPDVAAVFKASDQETANTLFKLIAAPASMFRAGVTLSPDFFPRNLIRDQFDALINSKNGFVPLLDTARGAASLINKDADFQDWLKSGGANAAMVSLDRHYLQNSVIKLNEETGFRDAAWNVVKSPFEALRVVSELAENATRLGEFKKAKQAGLSAGLDNKSAIQGAGYESREVTLDFARIGSKTQALNMLISFWNAQVQGVDRLARRIKEDPTGTALKIGASITLPSILLWANNHNDPRYDDQADWMKNMFWMVLTDHWRPAQAGDNPRYTRQGPNGTEFNDGTIYRIPKPHEAGILLGSGIERMLDYLAGKDPKGAGNYANDVLQSFLPGFTPTVAAPIIEQFANKSLFTGGSIIPHSTEQLLPEVQYQPYTTQTARAIGRVIGTLPGMNDPGSIASPSIIENYIRDWSGGLGMYTVQLADKGLREAGVLPDPVMPASTLADIPFIKAFVVRYPSAGAQPIQDFYQNYDKHSQVLNTVQYLATQGDGPSIVRTTQLMQDNPNALVQMSGIKEALSNQQKVIQMVTKNPSMNADDKRQIIDKTYYQMINMARMGNQIMGQIDRSMAK